MTNDVPLPSIGAPATRALAQVGIETLAGVANLSEKELAKLHGVGPKAVGMLKRALAEQGLEFRAQ